MSVKPLVTYIVYVGDPYHIIYELHSKSSAAEVIDLTAGTKTTSSALWGTVQDVIEQGAWRYIDKKDLKQYALDCALSGIDVNYIFED